VKSVGTVVLGVAKGGKVSIHDELQLYPSDKIVSVKSIQVHDEDVKDAPSGSRVGLALKGAGAEELERGMILAKQGSLQVAKEISLDVKFSKFYKGKPEVDKMYFLSTGMQYRQAKITEAKEEGRILKFQMQAPVVFSKDEIVLIIDPNSNLRICGSGKII